MSSRGGRGRNGQSPSSWTNPRQYKRQEEPMETDNDSAHRAQSKSTENEGTCSDRPYSGQTGASNQPKQASCDEKVISLSPEQASFLEDQCGDFNQCTVKYDHDKECLILSGSRAEVNSRKKKITELLKEVHETRMELTPVQRAILDKEEGREFLKGYLKDIKWHLFGNELVLLSKDTAHLEQTEQTLTKRLNGKERISIDGRVAEKVFSEFSKLKKEDFELVECSLEGESIIIEGLRDDVELAKREICDLAEEFALVDENLSVSGFEAEFIRKHLWNEFHQIFANVDVKHEEEHRGQISVQIFGTQENVDEVKRKFDEFVDEISLADVGINFKRSEWYVILKGRQLHASVAESISKFENENKCIVKFSQSEEGAAIEEDEEWGLLDEAAGGVAVDETENERYVSRTCKLHIKSDARDVTDERSEVLVCPMQEKIIENTTAVFSSFKKKCPGLEEELKSEIAKNTSGKMFTTSNSVTNLNCSTVIHAVLKRQNRHGNSKNLEDQIVKCLEQAVHLRAKSISFPAMGCGRAFKFTEQTAVSSALKAVKRFIGSTLENTLTEIVFIAQYAKLSGEFKNGLDTFFPRRHARTVAEESQDVSIVAAGRHRFTQLKTQLKSHLTKACLGTSERKVDLRLKDLPKSLHKSLRKSAEEYGVWLEKLQTKEVGYKITGAKEGREQMQGQIDQLVSRLQDRFPKHPIKSIKANRGTLNFLKEALQSDEDFPSYWSIDFEKYYMEQGEKPSLKRKEVGKTTHKAITSMIQSLWREDLVGNGQDAAGLDQTISRKIKVIKIERLENLTLYERYKFNRKHMLEKYAAKGKICKDISELESRLESLKSKGPVDSTANLESFMKNELLCEEVNEHYLFHGCKTDVVDDIVNEGFDFRLGQEGGMLGKGTYFAESPTKADQYADPRDKRSPLGTPLTMILARVLLGTPALVGNKTIGGKDNKKLSRPPCKRCLNCICSCGKKDIADSVLAQREHGLFREFVDYERHGSYPEYIITYVRVKC